MAIVSILVDIYTFLLPSHFLPFSSGFPLPSSSHLWSPLDWIPSGRRVRECAEWRYHMEILGEWRRVAGGGTASLRGLATVADITGVGGGGAAICVDPTPFKHRCQLTVYWRKSSDILKPNLETPVFFTRTNYWRCIHHIHRQLKVFSIN